MNVHATTGLTELISDMASDQLAEFAINALGLQPAVARATTRSTWTELVRELARQGSGANGSAKVLEWIMAPNIYRDLISNLNALLGSRHSADPLVGHGNSVIDDLFEDKAALYRRTVAAASGNIGTDTDPSGRIADLTAIAASIGLGVLKADFMREQVEPAQLRRMLRAQPEFQPHPDRDVLPMTAAPVGSKAAPVDVAPSSQPSAALDATDVTPIVSAPKSPFPVEGVSLAPLPFDAPTHAVANGASSFAIPLLRWLIPAGVVIALIVLGWTLKRENEQPPVSPARVLTPEATQTVSPALPSVAPSRKAEAPIADVEPIPTISTALDPPQSLVAGPYPRRLRFDALVFDSVEVNPSASALAALPPLASALMAAPSVAVRIEGFTDSEGDLEQNRRLASARATSVGKRLEALGVASTRIETMGRADTDPVASNETPEGRARNRRVEFVIAPR